METRRPADVTQIIFKTSDYWGNGVSLPHGTWDHVLRSHPEMRDKLDLIGEVVTNPHLISESSIQKNTLIFDGYNRVPQSSRIMRVVVRYEDRTAVESGSTNGNITTAYGPLTADTGKLGKVIYFAGLQRHSK